MADQAHVATERLPRRRSHTPDDNEGAFPTPAVSSRESTGRRKQHPTITPRRFERFFTPRSSLQPQAEIGTSRQVLRDITAGDSNRRSAGRRSVSKATLERSQSDREAFKHISKKRKRAVPITPDTSPENSSPVKGGPGPPIHIVHDEDDCEVDSDGGVSIASWPQQNLGRDFGPATVEPVHRWKRDNLIGQALSRESGGVEKTRGRPYMSCGPGRLKRL